MGGQLNHIQTLGMCTSKAAIQMCTSRGGRVNVNPKYTQTHTHMPQAAQLRQVDILVVNGVCLRAYMRNTLHSKGLPRYHQQYGETTTAKEGHQW